MNCYFLYTVEREGIEGYDITKGTMLDIGEPSYNIYEIFHGGMGVRVWACATAFMSTHGHTLTIEGSSNHQITNNQTQYLMLWRYFVSFIFYVKTKIFTYLQDKMFYFKNI